MRTYVFTTLYQGISGVHGGLRTVEHWIFPVWEERFLFYLTPHRSLVALLGLHSPDIRAPAKTRNMDVFVLTWASSLSSSYSRNSSYLLDVLKNMRGKCSGKETKKAENKRQKINRQRLSKLYSHWEISRQGEKKVFAYHYCSCNNCPSQN